MKGNDGSKMSIVNTSKFSALKTNTLLEIKNMSVDYYASNGTVHALTDVSITLERGKILGLAGESGSGKSTLAYAITRLLRPPAAITGGTVVYHRHAGQHASGTPANGRAGSAAGDETPQVDLL